MKTKQPDLPFLIGTSPICQAIIKAVGYGKKTCKEVIDTIKPVIERYGQPRVDEVAKVLLDYEQHGNQLFALLKPSLHVYCRQLLGPMPSEWGTWWKNADGSDRDGRPKVWPPRLPGPRDPKKRTKKTV